MRQGMGMQWIIALACLALWLLLVQAVFPATLDGGNYEAELAWTRAGGFSRFQIVPTSGSPARGALWQHAVRAQMEPYIDCLLRARGWRSAQARADLIVIRGLPVAKLSWLWLE